MTDGSHEEAIEEMWGDYAPIRDEVSDLLSHWQQTLVRGSPAEVREELRSFSDRQENVFRLLVLSFQDPDQFWADLETTIDQDAVDDLHQIRDKYDSQLGGLFLTVWKEWTYGHRNTITETSTTIELKNGGTDPVIKFEALSGRVPLFELHESPAHFIDLAETHVSSVNSALDLIEQFEESDIEDLQRQLARLEKKTAEVAETIEAIEVEEQSEDQTSSDVERTTEGEEG